jgi:putative acetyltransferase
MSAAAEELFPLVINYDDPHKDDIVTLLNDHLIFCRSTSPPEFVYALDVEALCTQDIAFYAGRVPISDQVVVIAALRILDEKHGELKSMHTVRSVRGRGYGKSMLRHVISDARKRGLERISLETGTMGEFSAARQLYESFGFVECDVFGYYEPSEYSVCMTLEITSEKL